jgi:proteic killer suppression protein
MEVYFGTNKLKKIFSNEGELKKTFGVENSNKIMLRLTQLHAASCLNDMKFVPGARFHQLEGKRKEQFAVDLKNPFRLVFKPNDDPIPYKDNNEIDLEKIFNIKIIEVVDYHGKK